GVTPIYAMPAVIAARILRRAAIAFHNTLALVLDVTSRCARVSLQVIGLFAAAFIREARACAGSVIRQVWLIARRVALPLIAVQLAALVTLRAGGVVPEHVFDPSLSSSAYVLWTGLELAVALCGFAASLAEMAVWSFVETYTRDVATALGFSIPILPIAALTLRLISACTAHIAGLDLGLRFGPFSWTCL